MKTKEKRILDEIEDIALEMRVELDGIKRLATMLEDELFGGRSPEKCYADAFEHYQALFHMMTHALYKFEGEFALLTGEEETHYYKCITQRPDRLRRISKWWNAPTDGTTQPSTMEGQPRIDSPAAVMCAYSRSGNTV